MTGPQLTAAIAWLLLIEGLALLAFPLLLPVTRNLPDKGWLLSKPAGLLLIGYPAWLLGNLYSEGFSRVSIAAVLTLALVAAVAWAWRHRARPAKRRMDLVTTLVLPELVFLGTFLLFLLLRLFDPELWNPVSGGEKPMDFSLLNACIRSDHLPPEAPWLSGHPVNYYYFGYVLFSIPSKLLGIPAEYAYNLALPTVAALTAAAAFTIVQSIQSRHEPIAVPGCRKSLVAKQAILWAGLGPLFVALIGNLFEARLLLSGLKKLGADNVATGIPVLGSLWSVVTGAGRLIDGTATWPYRAASFYWSATRVIPAHGKEVPPITEFPFFSLLYGDLHPHLMALPFTMLFIGLAVAAVLHRRGSSRLPFSESAWLAVSLTGILLIHPWNVPLSVFILVLLLWTIAEPGHRGGLARLRGAATNSTLVIVSALIFAAPFLVHYAVPVAHPAAWLGTQTPLGVFWDIFGLFLALIVTAGIFRLRDRPLEGSLEEPGVRVSVLLLLVAVAIWLDWTDYPLTSAAALVAVLIVAGSLRVMLKDPNPEDRIPWALVITGSIGIVISETLTFGNGVGHMNTVFKFYYQVWLYWALAAAALSPEVFQRLMSLPGRWLRIGACTGFLALLAASCLYPPFSLYGKMAGRWSKSVPNLDGSLFMESARLPLGDILLPLRPDLEGIRWLKQNVPDAKTLVEAAGSDYSWAGRISSSTGIPTVIGWPSHVLQHHPQLTAGEVDDRVEAVREIYESIDVESILPLLRRFNIGYIYVGPLERKTYAPDGLRKFDQPAPGVWEPAYIGSGTRILRITINDVPSKVEPEGTRSGAHRQPIDH